MSITPDAAADATIRVLVIDDSPDITDLFARLISAQRGLACVGTLHHAEDLAGHAARLRPHVIVLDLTMPGKDPLDAIAELERACPQVRVVGFSGYDSPRMADAVLNAGGWGLISKHGEVADVIEAIRDVASGEVVVRRGV
ncbi:MAG: response regulator transcription factor [Planctomycetota bacterium]|nr:response regulator transcription factor [Planctomycetota bacterium]